MSPTIDPTIPGDGPYILHKALKLLPEAEQTYFVGAHFEDGTDEWWNNRMGKPQATALCAALNWWYANRSVPPPPPHTENTHENASSRERSGALSTAFPEA